jgi:hypothetical protein
MPQQARWQLTKHKFFPRKLYDAPVNHTPHGGPVLLLKPVKEFLNNRRVVTVYFKSRTVIAAGRANVASQLGFYIRHNHMLKIKAAGTV